MRAGRSRPRGEIEVGLFNSGQPKGAPKQPTPKPAKPKKVTPRRGTTQPKRGNKPGT